MYEKNLQFTTKKHEISNGPIVIKCFYHPQLVRVLVPSGLVVRNPFETVKRDNFLNEVF